MSGIGSLSEAPIRFAGAKTPEVIGGPLELLTLSGTLSCGGSTFIFRSVIPGGHLKEGAIVRTTVELIIAILPEWKFDRVIDSVTTSKELKVSRFSRPT